MKNLYHLGIAKLQRLQLLSSNIKQEARKKEVTANPQWKKAEQMFEQMRKDIEAEMKRKTDLLQAKLKEAHDEADKEKYTSAIENVRLQKQLKSA